MLQVAKQHQDQNEDAVYRNGLQVFISQLENGGCKKVISVLLFLYSSLEERRVKELGVVLLEKARSRGLWNSMLAKVNQYGT